MVPGFTAEFVEHILQIWKAPPATNCTVLHWCKSE